MSTGGSIFNGEESSNRHACAACKHQRRRCKPQECVLSQYFPASRMEEFQAILKLFGVSKVTKLLIGIDARYREQAVRSLLWEADAWSRDPVNGPLGFYKEQRRENEWLKNLLWKQQNQNPQPYNTNWLDNQELIGQPAVAVANGGDHAMFNNNWPQHNTSMLKHQQGRGIAIVEPNNIAANCRGNNWHGSREQGSCSSRVLENNWQQGSCSSRVLEGQDHEGVVNQNFVAQGNYDDRSGTGYTVPYPDNYSQNPRPEIHQETYNNYNYQLAQRQLPQQQHQQQQHMSNTHRK